MKALGEVIAERELRVVEDNRMIRIQFARPVKVDEDEWVCKFRIIGLRGAKPMPLATRSKPLPSGEYNYNRIIAAVGGDGLSALLNALTGIRGVLEGSGKNFIYPCEDPDGSEIVKNWTGIPIIGPSFLDKKFEVKIKEMVERQEQHFAAQRIRKRKKESARNHVI